MPRKKSKVKAAPRVKRGGKIVGPSFEGWETWTGEAFNKFRRDAHTFYYENYKPADLMSSVWLWMKENGYSKEQIRQAKAAPGAYAVSTTSAICCKLIEDGCPDFNPEHDVYWQSCKGTAGNVKPMSEHIRKDIDEAIEHGKDVVEEVQQEEKQKATVKQPTIQDRIFEHASNVSGEIDTWLDAFAEDPSQFDSNGFNVKSHLLTNKITQAHARKIIAFYEKDMADVNELLNLPTAAQVKKLSEQEQDWIEQLKEGYSHLSKTDAKKLLKAYQSIIDACNMIIESSKATRKVRKPKQRSATKIVEKLKYKKQDDKYTLVSINPVEVVGASELWVFNTKTRKLGKYVASSIDPKGMSREGTGLNVKGTTILGFDPEASVQKTLRKPEEQLKEFKDAGKVALRKFLENINTTDTKLNGRINPDTVLLKVN